MTSLRLLPPSAHLHESWLRNTEEWDGADQQGASVFLADKNDWDLKNPNDFSRWVDLLNDLAETQNQPPAGFVNQCTLWLERDEEYLGAVSLRYALINDFLQVVGGHIGYGIRPSARGEGLAAKALMAILDVARARGMQRVLLTCDDSNIGSAKTIEACGGQLEKILPVAQLAAQFGSVAPVRRYWIDL
ncbi:GNAT family N-acetyltransferase [Arthrobacter sp. MYb213]|uniref:GNAT family N-acetyltransferase n=1 Tax=Arthrobacter sp. MYb213 TaxID=1848595 RepID=UPI000CFD2A9E|nr:GNAT family N-acetyltransferase [Arthrobacter sp. MYb213]PRB68719.1 GNAT family N-acetyltransferase [Arthrobacter sp. MYb213]